MDQQQQYCLKWSNYSSNLAAAFSNLFNTETLTDVTLFCEGTIFKAHKLILAACSKNFADLFETPSLATGSVCVILEATSAENMAALLEFMYKGEVHVSQKALESFLKAAESLQVKGLTTEHGRCTTDSTFPHGNPPIEVPARRQRNSFSNLDPITKSGIKRETDLIMQSAVQTFPNYLPQPYMPSPYEPARKRHMKNPYTNLDQQETRGSVLRDGSKTSTGSPSPIGKTPGYRPASSGSSVAPEADTLLQERDSPQQSNRYENHSPSTTQGNGTSSSTSERDERNGTDKAADLNIKNEAGAEDLRMKMEMRQLQSPLATSAPPTPTTPVAPFAGNKGIPGSLEGKKLQCPLCDRQYGYETNLRAHIRQRHQGIRVPCPFCTRTFTRNNTVRRHIAREHKHQQIVAPFQS